MSAWKQARTIVERRNHNLATAGEPRGPVVRFVATLIVFLTGGGAQ